MPERDELPENFESLEEFWDFWDNHDAGDYWAFTKDIHFDVKIEPRIDNDILQKVKKIASQNGVSVEALINQWLKEKLEVHAI